MRDAPIGKGLTGTEFRYRCRGACGELLPGKQEEEPSGGGALCLRALPLPHRDPRKSRRGVVL